jgi:hypothetical protein
MNNSSLPPEVVFPEGYFGRWEDEAPYKGYLPEVVAKYADGSRYKLFFVDPIRLARELEAETASGRPYFGEPNLIVLPRVTTDAIRNAIVQLHLDGYFDRVGAEASKLTLVTEHNFAGAA